MRGPANSLRSTSRLEGGAGSGIKWLNLSWLYNPEGPESLQGLHI